MAPKFHVNPRHRAYGKARIELAKRIKTQQDWDQMWKDPIHPFPFAWDSGWRQCIEYKVDDFAAEVGFFIDVLGLRVNAFGPQYAMFTSPNGDFYFGVACTPPGQSSTPPDAVRIQFMVADMLETVKELERRGIVFEHEPQPSEEGSTILYGYFRTPHGICIDLWGETSSKQQKRPSRVYDPEF